MVEAEFRLEYPIVLRSGERVFHEGEVVLLILKDDKRDRHYQLLMAMEDTPINRERIQQAATDTASPTTAN